ncbi:MAG: SulP family inorganic anion transporter [Candidatus Korobacteraceae bacterium]
MKTEQEGTFKQDFLASIVVFLVALPLCMGIAIASGAPPAAGLITGIVGGIVVGSLSGCPLQVSGPAAGLAVINYQLIQEHGIAMLGPIVVLAGITQLIAGGLRLGQVFRAISPSVIYGMLAGIGVLILAAQFHVMVDDQPRPSGLQNLISIPESLYKGVFPLDGSTHHLAALVGLTTIVMLIVWNKFAPAKVKWIPGALVGVLVATTIAAVAKLPIRYVDIPNNLLGSIQVINLETLSGALNPTILFAALAMAFVASAETLLSATAVDQMHDGPRTKYNKELMSQGVGNTICGMVGALPMTGVIVRSATNVAAGARTRLSTMMHGGWLLILVAALPFVLRLVPTSALAAILVYTGYKLVNPQNVKRLLQYGGMPVIIYAVTLTTVVTVDLLTGIIAGLALSLVKVVYALTRMGVEVRKDPSGQRVDIHLSGAATFVRLPTLADALDQVPQGVETHIHFQKLDYIDHACLDAIANWEKQRTEKGSPVVLEWDGLMDKYQSRNHFMAPENTARRRRPVLAAGHDH